MPNLQRRRNAVQHVSRINTNNLKQRLKFVISFDGRGFFGFQSQCDPAMPTIQDNLENRLKKLFRRKIVVFGCGRTDAGVHALNYVFHIDLFFSELKTFNIEFLKNHFSRASPVKLTSPTIVVKAVSKVSNQFDARFSCREKTYVYNFSCIQCSPFSAQYCWSLPETYRAKSSVKGNVELLMKAMKLLSGRHNFVWLVIINENEQREYTRNLEIRLETFKFGSLLGEKESFKLRFTSDFFLHRMVRRLVGLLINVMLEKVELALLERITKFFDSSTYKYKSHEIPLKLKEIWGSPNSNLSNLINTAPAKGLFLETVCY